MRSTPSIGTCRASRSTANPHQPAFPIKTFGPHPEERRDEDCPPQAGISLRFLKLPRNSSSSPCVSIHTFVYLLGADDQHPNPFRTNAIANAAPPPDRRAVAHAFHPADLRASLPSSAVAPESAQPNAAHGAVLLKYFLLSLSECGMAYWAWAGVHWKGGNLRDLTGGR